MPISRKSTGSRFQCLKSTGDEDSTDDEGPELADGTKAAKKKTTGSAHGGDGPSTSGRGASGSRGKKRGRDDDGGEDDPNKCRKTGGETAPPPPLVARKEPCKKGTVYPRLTESCQSSTSLVRRREPCLATAYWTGLRSRRGRYMRRGCRGD